jgi:hypothetical protein
METIHGAPSYTLRSTEVELAVTQTAGHLAPVTFNFPGLKASPYSLSPWTPTQIDQSLPNLLTYLRGDFMCLPFGGQEKGPPHGDTANAPWQLASSSATSSSTPARPPSAAACARSAASSLSPVCVRMLRTTTCEQLHTNNTIFTDCNR